MTLEFEVDVDYLTDGGIKGMPTWVKLNDEGGGHASTVYVNSSSYWHVVEENGKLRELVRQMHTCLTRPKAYTGASQPYLVATECPYFTQGVCDYNSCGFEQRMSELGVIEWSSRSHAASGSASA